MWASGAVAHIEWNWIGAALDHDFLAFGARSSTPFLFAFAVWASYHPTLVE